MDVYFVTYTCIPVYIKIICINYYYNKHINTLLLETHTDVHVYIHVQHGL